LSAEHENGVARCWNKKDWPYPHNKEQSGWYLERCEHDCGEAFKQCEEEQEEAARWKDKMVVIVAGVAFVLATGGSGALILTPLAL
jgi:hypothetical protein